MAQREVELETRVGREGGDFRTRRAFGRSAGCPMSRCSRGVWMGRSSSGTPGPNGFTALRRTRQSGASATRCCKPNSRSNSPNCVRSCWTSGIGRASCAISARTAAKSSSTAGCSCSATTPCSRSIATSRRSKRSYAASSAAAGTGRYAAKFEALFNQSGIFAGIMDLQGYMREVNDLAVDACGYTREQVLDRPFWDTPWWRGSEEMKARIRFATEQAASGLVFREELRYWVADGSERVVDFAMHPIRDQSGAVTFLHPTGIDITERKHVEAALRDSEHGCVGWHRSSSPATTQSSARTSMASSPAGTGAPSISSATLPKRRSASPSRSSFRTTGRTKSARF